MSLPYFPMYPSDFEAKTSHLTIAEDGAYNRLLRICWMTPGCTMPADEAWIMRRARASSEEDRATVRSVLEEFFSVKDGRYSNAKLSEVFVASNEAHEKRKNAGSKGGKAKALKSNEKQSSNAVAKPKQPEPEPEPYKEREEPKGSLSLQGDVMTVDDISIAVKKYNEAADKSGWPRVQILSKARRSALAARLRDAGGIDGWIAALAKAQSSDHCCGQNERGWCANFDFLTRQSSFTKLMEGNYDNRISPSNRPADRREDRPDPALEQIARLTGIG